MTILKNLIGSFAVSVVIWLNTILSKRFFSSLKKLKDYKYRAFSTIDTQLRISSETYLHYGDDENMDKTYNILTCHFLEVPLTEIEKEYQKLHNEKIEEIKGKISHEVWESLEDSKRWYNKLSDLYNSAQIITNITDTDAWKEFIKRSNIKSQILKEISQKDVKQLLRQIDKELTKNKTIIRNGKRIKILLDKDSIGMFIQVATPLFLFTGFIYNNVYYNYLGIKISNYATLTDYISTSFDKVSLIIIGACVNILTLFLGLSHSSSLPKHTATRSSKRSDLNILLIVLYLLITLGLTFTYPSESGLLRINIIQVLIGIVSTYFIWEYAWNYFSKPTKPVFCLIFISATLIVTIGNAVKDAISIRAHNVNSEYIRGDGTPVPDTFSYVGSNSGYFFFMDGQDKKLIIRGDNIKEVRTK